VNRPAVRGSLRRSGVAIVIVIGLGIALAACGNGGTALAQQACAHVQRAMTLLKRSDHQTDPAQVAKLKEQATSQLQDALPIAAQAAYHDGQWQALMTTLSEINRVPATTLVTALTAQCRSAKSSTFGGQSPPSSIPPPAPFPSSPDQGQ
jgi:hypothetical protein